MAPGNRSRKRARSISTVEPSSAATSDIEDSSQNTTPAPTKRHKKDIDIIIGAKGRDEAFAKLYHAGKSNEDILSACHYSFSIFGD